ncbi:Glu/Leu/Phe/Val dehydrogenase dimerization domain-containing protein [Streptomyces hiroshimensis]|uniref:Glutamate dehydrogenase n=1 Tax=Streptomyces hiroshimensis TaxID=66424 RepID=A0ABQ2Y3Q9_9ACTN|nr:Glu/Leu/Phe/Val dehydrogenase dimerization domain-containing protein [Streptomyces hiroshimensis]GGX62210.1 glutamate dehydrogenase [Streptomyces hiroshimensis]
MNDPYLQVTWTDRETEARGYLVIDRLLGGASSGGLRMRSGCTLAEVADLARTMSLKEALNYRPSDRYVPYGGAKGGIDFDPRHPGARAVLTRYLSAMKPFIETCWATGEDLGVQQRTLDEAAAEASIESTVQAALPHVPDGRAAGLARLAAGFAAEVDGISLADLIGGYGVARATVAALEHRGDRVHGATAALQGFGTMGGAIARYLTEAGLRVVAVADQDGVVANPAGLAVEHLLAHRTRDGRIDRDRLKPYDKPIASNWLATPCDVLVTAAVPYAVNESNHHLITARYVVEGANISVTPAAERELFARGTLVIPDFVANSAGNAWWWWTLFGDIEPTAASAFRRVSTVMEDLVVSSLDGAADTSTTPRTTAAARAETSMALLNERPRG